MSRNQFGQIQIRNRVPVHHEKRAVFKELFDLFDAAARSQQHRFLRIRKLHAPLRTIAQYVPDLLAQVVQIDHHVLNAMTAQQQEIPHKKGIGAQGQERFRHGLRQRTEPDAETRCQDHGFHGIVVTAIREYRA